MYIKNSIVKESKLLNFKMIFTLLPLQNFFKTKYCPRKKKNKNIACLQNYLILFVKYLALFYLRFPVQINIILSSKKEINNEQQQLKVNFNLYKISTVYKYSLKSYLKKFKSDNKFQQKCNLCTICQEKINRESESYQCAHCDCKFHVNCICKWLDCKHSQLQCPNCRQLFFYKSPDLLKT